MSITPAGMFSKPLFALGDLIADTAAFQDWAGVANYTVTGDGDPSPNGDYTENGTYGGYPKYTHADGTYELWQDGALTFVISTAAGTISPDYWSRATPIAGSYDAAGSTYTGNPSAAAYSGRKAAAWDSI